MLCVKDITILNYSAIHDSSKRIVLIRIYILLYLKTCKDEDLYISKEILKSMDLAGQSSAELNCSSNWNNQLNFYKIVLFSLYLHILDILDSHTFLHFGQF